MRLFVKPEDNTTRDFYLTHKSAYEGDSGIDLFVPEKTVCSPGKTTLVDLNMAAMMTPDRHMNPVSFLVYPRSSISKTPLILHNSVGVIDSKYRNTIKIALFNTSSEEYTVEKGDRLVQICSSNLEEIKITIVDRLPSSDRGSGFGSSGRNNLDSPVDKNVKRGFVDRFKSIFS